MIQIQCNVQGIKNALEKIYNCPKNIVAKKGFDVADKNIQRIPVVQKKATNRTLKPHGNVRYYFRGVKNHLGEKIQYEKMLASGINGNLLFFSHMSENKTDVLLMNPCIAELSFFSSLSKKVSLVLQ